MSERNQPDPLEAAEVRRFKGVTTEELIANIEDPGYEIDHERGWAELELTRRLKEEGKSWRWVGETVEVFDSDPADEVKSILEAIEAWEESDRKADIDDVHARMIAMVWDEGAPSDLHSFVMTGRIKGRVLLELMANMGGGLAERDEPAFDALCALLTYLLHSGPRDEVDGWDESTRF